MGFRGSRGFGTRSAPTSPYYRGGNPSQQSNGFAQQPSQPAGAYDNSTPMGGGLRSGGFMRGLMGGLAGGMIGSMLFGGLGHAGGLGGFGGGGIGLLEILLLVGLGYMLFRFLFSRGGQLAATGAHREMTHYERLRSVETGPFVPPTQGRQPGGEPACVDTLARYDASFDLAAFKDGRMDDFMKLQAAWNHRDLSSLSALIAPELRSKLDEDIAQLKASGRINRIENIAVRGSDLIEAWQERGLEYATIRFRANLTDYTIDETSGQVVAGDRLQPVKFEEDWTFVREIDAPASSKSWKISAIEA